VFRYALRGAESEWAVLDDELEFVRAYLEVERARFGSRLRVEVRLADEVRGARVPTMMVQTLVENAVKHGVARVRGPASVEVGTRREDERLVVTVSDSGPGFDAEPAGQKAGRSVAHGEGRPKPGGYGLANVRQRLEGYFGEGASLTIARDAERGRTIVAVSMPLEWHVGRQSIPTISVTESEA
jgi:LytS/YehU family sensor histidine kinase